MNTEYIAPKMDVVLFETETSVMIISGNAPDPGGEFGENGEFV